jgi:hypothetical protein
MENGKLRVEFTECGRGIGGFDFSFRIPDLRLQIAGKFQSGI